MRSTRSRIQFVVVLLVVVLAGASAGWGASICSSASISVDPNPATEGDLVDLLGKAVQASSGSGCDAGSAGTPITTGTLDVEQRVVGATGVSCATTHLCTAGLVGAACTGPDTQCDTTLGAGDGDCTAATFEALDGGTPDGSGEFTTAFDTTGLGGSTLGFRSHYKSTGGSGFKQAQSPCVDLVVEEPVACSEGVEIAATLASGDGTPAPGPNKTTKVGPWEFRITVTACEDATNVSAQGGDNGWAPTAKNGSQLDEDTGNAYIRKENRRNNVIKWEIGDMTAGQVANLDVEVDGPIPPGTPDCQIRGLSGNWSALYSLDGGATYQKTAYTGKVTVQVDSDGDGNLSCP